MGRWPSQTKGDMAGARKSFVISLGVWQPEEIRMAESWGMVAFPAVASATDPQEAGHWPEEQLDIMYLQDQMFHDSWRPNTVNGSLTMSPRYQLFLFLLDRFFGQGSRSRRNAAHSRENTIVFYGTLSSSATISAGTVMASWTQDRLTVSSLWASHMSTYNNGGNDISKRPNGGWQFTVHIHRAFFQGIYMFSKTKDWSTRNLHTIHVFKVKSEEHVTRSTAFGFIVCSDDVDRVSWSHDSISGTRLAVPKIPYESLKRHAAVPGKGCTRLVKPWKSRLCGYCPVSARTNFKPPHVGACLPCISSQLTRVTSAIRTASDPRGSTRLSSAWLCSSRTPTFQAICKSASSSLCGNVRAAAAVGAPTRTQKPTVVCRRPGSRVAQNGEMEILFVSRRG
jgi:hypothetical protein